MTVIVVGLGSMGKRRIRLLQKFDQVERIVGVDSRQDRRDEVEAQFGCSVCDSISQAAALCGNGDCAFVCTSPLSHGAIISELLNHDLHVFTEINLVSDGYEKNMQLAREKNKALFLSSTFYYREEIQFIRDGIKGRNNLNYVYHIGQYLPDWHPWESYKDYFLGDKLTNGCREIMAIELPWLTGTFGDVADCHVISGNRTKLNIDYKDYYMVQMTHESGVTGCFIVDVVSPKAVRKLEVYGEDVYYAWDGTPTGIEFYDAEDKQVKPVNLYETIDQRAGYRAFIVENAYENEIRQFFAQVVDGVKPPYGFEEDLKVLKLIDKIEGM